jgi:DNA-binding transcriptional LysR family regulator
MQVRVVCAAHPNHPLHKLGRVLSRDDLRAHRHLVVRDSGSDRTRTTAWLNERRWTVSHKATTIRAAAMGLGYAWFPEETIREELHAGQLKPLPLAEGGERKGFLYLMYADRDSAGPGVLRLAEILREGAQALDA